MVDVLNKDQGLIQTKLSKKLQHVESECTTSHTRAVRHIDRWAVIY